MWDGDNISHSWIILKKNVCFQVCIPFTLRSINRSLSRVDIVRVIAGRLPVYLLQADYRIKVRKRKNLLI